MVDIAIRNKSLFHVDGREMVLFDEKLTMELPVHDGESTPRHTEQGAEIRRKANRSHASIQHRCPSYKCTFIRTIQLILVPTN